MLSNPVNNFFFTIPGINMIGERQKQIDLRRYFKASDHHQGQGQRKFGIVTMEL